MKSGVYTNSSSLEIKGFDGIGEYERKEHSVTDHSGREDSQEVVLIPKVIVQVLLHRLLPSIQGVCYISELGHEQPVHRPRNRASPEVPPPPYRYALWEREQASMSKGVKKFMKRK